MCRNSTWIEPDSKSNLAFAQSEGLYPASKSSFIWNGSACGIDLEKFDISKKEEYRSTIREKYQIPLDAFEYIFVGRVKRDKGINDDHDNRLGDFVHVAVGAHLCGTVEVGSRTWVGVGATVSNNISVCDDCLIGAGAVVVKDIKEKGTYIGVPARNKKLNTL